MKIGNPGGTIRLRLQSGVGKVRATLKVVMTRSSRFSDEMKCLRAIGGNDEVGYDLMAGRFLVSDIL